MSVESGCAVGSRLVRACRVSPASGVDLTTLTIVVFAKQINLVIMSFFTGMLFDTSQNAQMP